MTLQNIRSSSVGAILWEPIVSRGVEPAILSAPIGKNYGMKPSGTIMADERRWRRVLLRFGRQCLLSFP